MTTHDIDLAPATARGAIRNDSFVPAVARPQPPATMQTIDPAMQRSLVERVLSTPAPVPARDMRISERQRLEGAIEKSTPLQRAYASFVRSSKYMLGVMGVGVIGYVAVGNGVLMTFATIIICMLIMLGFDLLEYSYSQPGVEKQRGKLDHKLEMTHEDNRHTETMTAITGDLELKNKMLDIAANRMLGVREDE